MSAVIKQLAEQFTVVDIQTVTPQQLAEQLFAARAAEKAATAARVAAEEALVEAVGFAKTEGQQIETFGDLKVTLKASLNRKVDWEKFDAISSQIPADLQPVKVERRLDEVGVKYLSAEHPALYRVLAKALTVTPAKTSVTIVRTA